jgi:hypothetical protein
VIDGARLRLQLPGPMRLFIQPAGAKPILLCAEKTEVDPPRPGAPGVAVPADHGFAAGPGQDLTRTIQQTLDQLAAGPGAKILHLPDGLYPCNGLKIPSGVTLHLAPGAVLKKSGSGPGNGKLLYNVPQATIHFESVRDAAVIGRGIIDSGHTGGFGVAWHESERCRIDGVVLRNVPFWHGVMARSKRCTGSNLVMLSPGCRDGINPNQTQDCVLEDNLLWGDDDPASIGSDYAEGPDCTNTVVRRMTILNNHNLLMSPVCLRPIRGVLFQDIHAIRNTCMSSYIWKSPAPYEDVVYERVQLYRGSIRFADLGKDTGPRRNITFRDCAMHTKRPAEIGAGYQNVRIENLEIAGALMYEAYPGYFTISPKSEVTVVVTRPPPAELIVDCGREGQHIEAGTRGWMVRGAKDPAAVTKTFDRALTGVDALTVALSPVGITGNGPSEGAHGRLVADALMSSGTLTMTLSGLPAGRWRIRTWHHSRDTRNGATLARAVTDADGVRKLDAVTQTSGPGDAPPPAEVGVRSDGTPLTLTFTPGAKQQVALCGFAVVAIP